MFVELYGDGGLELIIQGVVRDKSGNKGGLGNKFATLGHQILRNKRKLLLQS